MQKNWNLCFPVLLCLCISSKVFVQSVKTCNFGYMLDGATCKATTALGEESVIPHNLVPPRPESLELQPLSDTELSVTINMPPYSVATGGVLPRALPTRYQLEWKHEVIASRTERQSITIVQDTQETEFTVFGNQVDTNFGALDATSIHEYFSSLEPSEASTCSGYVTSYTRVNIYIRPEDASSNWAMKLALSRFAFRSGGAIFVDGALQKRSTSRDRFLQTNPLPFNTAGAWHLVEIYGFGLLCKSIPGLSLRFTKGGVNQPRANLWLAASTPLTGTFSLTHVRWE